MAVTRFRQKCSSAHHIFNGRTFDYSAEQKKNIQRAMVGKVKSQMRLSKKTERFLQPAPPPLALLPQFSGVRVDNISINQHVISRNIC
jgi:hypothetical protein